MEVFVGEDDVAFLGEARDSGHARKVARGVDVAGFAAEEGGEVTIERAEAALQRRVVRYDRAADPAPHSSHARVASRQIEGTG